MIKKKLGEILKGMGLIEEPEIQEALEFQKENPMLFGEALIKLGYVKEENILWALAQQFELPCFPIEWDKIDPEVAKLIPHDFARNHGVLPLYKIENELALAIEDPRVIPKVEKLKTLLKPLSKIDLTFSVVKKSELRTCLESVWGQREIKETSPFLKKEEIRSDPTGESLLESLIEKTLEENSPVLHFDFYPSSALVWCQKKEKVEKIGELGEEWARILKNLLKEKGSSLLIKKSGEPDRPYRIFWNSSPLQDTAVLRQSLSLPPLSDRAEEIAASLSRLKRGLVFFTGQRTVMEKLLLSTLAKFSREGSRVVGWAPHRLYEGTGVVWLEGGKPFKKISHFHPQAIYLDTALRKKALSEGMRLALEGNLVFLGLYAPSLLQLSQLNFMARKQRKAFKVVLESIIEGASFPILCDHCKKPEELPFYLRSLLEEEESSSFLPLGCSHCKDRGYQEEEEVIIEEAKFTQDLLEFLEGDFQKKENHREKYQNISPFYQKCRELLKAGKISWREFRIFL